MAIERDDPAYALRWPAHLFAEEVDKLVVAGRSASVDDAWEVEVETLLRQAFKANEPLEEFRRLQSPPARGAFEYDGEEPF